MKTGNTSHFLKKIADITARPFESEDDKAQHIIEHTAGYMLLKRLIQRDKEKSKTRDSGNYHFMLQLSIFTFLCANVKLIVMFSVLFSDFLLAAVPESSLQLWINSNRAAFILVL